MINLIHEAEIHGATVDEKTQVSVILESLTPAFLPFTTNYIMNKLEYNFVGRSFKIRNKTQELN